MLKTNNGTLLKIHVYLYQTSVIIVTHSAVRIAGNLRQRVVFHLTVTIILVLRLLIFLTRHPRHQKLIFVRFVVQVLPSFYLHTASSRIRGLISARAALWQIADVGHLGLKRGALRACAVVAPNYNVNQCHTRGDYK